MIGRALPTSRTMAEFEEQRHLVAALELFGVPFLASMNGARMGRAAAGIAKATGMRRGVPDLMIVRPPPAMAGQVGMAIELKRADLKPKSARAARWSGATVEQRETMAMLELYGWHCVVAYGAADALRQLAAAGYSVGRLA